MTKPSKRSPTRLPQQREADLALIARLYLRGYSQAEILRRMNSERVYPLTGPQIGIDLQELHKRWVESQLIDLNAAKQQELERLRLLEEAYWQAWERSTQKQVEMESELTDDKGIEGAAVTRQRNKTITRERDGAEGFLKGIERCIELRCKILGLFDPKKVALVDWQKQAEEAGVPASQAVQEFEVLVAKYQSAAGHTPD